GNPGSGRKTAASPSRAPPFCFRQVHGVVSFSSISRRHLKPLNHGGAVMRKVRMNLDALQVESFDTSPADARTRRGTVHARGGTVEPYPDFPQGGSYPNCPSPLCVDTPLASCDGSCRYTCGASCNGTCNSCVTCNTCQESC